MMMIKTNIAVCHVLLLVCSLCLSTAVGAPATTHQDTTSPLSYPQNAHGYHVTATRLQNDGKPLLDKHRVPHSSSFDFNYNPATFLRYNPTDGTPERYIMVRVQNRTRDEYSSNSTTRRNRRPWSYGGPSQFAVARVYSPTNVTRISNDNVVFRMVHHPRGDDNTGQEQGSILQDIQDPRIVFHDSVYYLYYTYTDKSCTPHACAMLSLATCNITAECDPIATAVTGSSRSWQNEGPLWPNGKVGNFQWTKAGAVLLDRQYDEHMGSDGNTSGSGSPKHYLFWSNWCEFEPRWVSPLYVNVATSENLRNWTILPSPLMDKRRSCASFDSYVLESGPPPVRLLNTGDYLFLYNAAKQCPTGKPNYERCYAIGYVVLDRRDPTRVIARSPPTQPLLVPELEWEVGDPNTDQTPNVVFVEALYRDGGGVDHDGREQFIAFYAGSDTSIGSLRITVEMRPEEAGPLVLEETSRTFPPLTATMVQSARQQAFVASWSQHHAVGSFASGFLCAVGAGLVFGLLVLYRRRRRLGTYPEFTRAQFMPIL